MREKLSDNSFNNWTFDDVNICCDMVSEKQEQVEDTIVRLINGINLANREEPQNNNQETVICSH